MTNTEIKQHYIFNAALPVKDKASIYNSLVSQVKEGNLGALDSLMNYKKELSFYDNTPAKVSLLTEQQEILKSLVSTDDKIINGVIESYNHGKTLGQTVAVKERMDTCRKVLREHYVAVMDEFDDEVYAALKKAHKSLKKIPEDLHKVDAFSKRLERVSDAVGLG